MLNSISWSQFFTAVALIAGGYYLISIFLLYSTEIKNLLKGKPAAQADDTNDSTSHRDVLGTTRSVVKPQATDESHSTGSPKVAPPNDPERNSNQSSDEELLTGAVSDLLDEIKSKIKTLQDWNKDEVLGVFRELLEKYPQLKGTVYQESINHFIANVCSEHFQWSLEPEEVQPLWP